MSDRRPVYLRAGVTIPLGAVWAALAIERAGHRLTLDGPDLFVQLGGPLNPLDLAELRRWKPSVRLLLGYTVSDSGRSDIPQVSKPESAWGP